MTIYTQEQLEFLQETARKQLGLLREMRAGFEADMQAMFSAAPMPGDDIPAIYRRILERLNAHKSLFSAQAARPPWLEAPEDVLAERNEIHASVMAEIDALISQWSRLAQDHSNGLAEEQHAVWKKKLELERELAKKRAERFKTLWERQRRS